MPLPSVDVAKAMASSMEHRTASGRPKHVNPNASQAQLLDELERRVNETPNVFEQAQRNRDIHQKRLKEMIEETLKQIHLAESHMQLKAKHVRDTSALYNAKFERELSLCQTDLRRDVVERLTIMEEAIERLETSMSNVEVDINNQRKLRSVEIEATLGPIMAKVNEVTLVLENEKRHRKLEESCREKMLADQLQAHTHLVEEEKHDRELQIAEFTRWQEQQREKLAKCQFHVEQETLETAAGYRHELEAVSKERMSCQNGVIESIASFIKNFREQVSKELTLA